MGDAGLVATLLRLHPGPRQSFMTIEPEHIDNLLTGYASGGRNPWSACS
jgi:hypothetical protein